MRPFWNRQLCGLAGLYWRLPVVAWHDQVELVGIEMMFNCAVNFRHSLGMDKRAGIPSATKFTSRQNTLDKNRSILKSTSPCSTLN